MSQIAGKPSCLESIRGRHIGGRKPALATVSGIASTTVSMIDWFARETCVDIITTKSIELEPNPGNREPVITEPMAGCFGNAVGLRNPGVEVASAEFGSLREAWERDPPPRLPHLNVSLSGSSADDFVTLALRLSPFADMLELNFSCPHAADGFGAAIGSNPDAIRTITRAVVKAVDMPVVVKLTPNVDRIAVMAMHAVESGASGIAAINTVGPARYVEPITGEPVLTNPPDGKGGMSGNWIHHTAVEAVRSIRSAVGPDPAVIGMGGVVSSAGVAAMHRAGADAVGIGSALGSLHQRDWPAFFAGLVPEADNIDEGPETSALYEPGGGQACEIPVFSRGAVILQSTKMSYRRLVVLSAEFLDPTIVEITLKGGLSAAPGQTVFLWIPGTGEKPFAVALNDPLTFVVKIKGAFTRALADRKPGDDLYVRGPCGDRHAPRLSVRRVLMVVAGTGIAAVSLLVHELVASGTEVRVLLGMREAGARTPLRGDTILQRVTRVVPDNGTEGAVLAVFAAELSAAGADMSALYLAGPDGFIDRGLVIAREAGSDPERTFISLERRMSCGVGLCGACDCGGRLTCQNGTFVTAAALAAERFRSADLGRGE